MYEYLIAIDGDEDRARLQAETVAEQPKGASEVHATLLHVFEDEEGSTAELEAAQLARDILEEGGIEVDFDATTGEPTTCIIEKAEVVDARRICVAGKKRAPTGKLLFGSVTQGVILSTTRPVLVCSAIKRE